MTRLKFFRFFLISFTALFFISAANAEVIQDKDFKFSLDIPEGYEISDYTEDGMSYIFSHPNIPVTLVLKVYYDEKFTRSSDVLSQALNKLSAVYNADCFIWSEQECCISTISMTLDQTYAGWAVCAPTLIENGYVVLLCYAPQLKEKACEQFIISTINSLCINPDYYNVPGIITTYAYPPTEKKEITLNIDGHKINTTIDKDDIEAADFVVDLEYSVLTLYAKHNKWKEAWQRYYKMIYRDSYGRLARASFDILKEIYPLAEIQNPDNPDIAYAQSLLSWVQGFDYQRAKTSKSSDFTSLPATISGQGNDCDSRSMLICVLLNGCGIDTIMLFSPEYSHAMAATGIKAPGQTYRLEENKKEYLFGETTAKVTWGMIAQDQSDRTKWIPVTFPETIE